MPSFPSSRIARRAAPQSHVLEGEVLDPIDPGPERPHVSPGGIDIGAVITKALKAAGLMNGR